MTVRLLAVLTCCNCRGTVAVRSIKKNTNGKIQKNRKHFYKTSDAKKILESKQCTTKSELANEKGPLQT